MSLRKTLLRTLIFVIGYTMAIAQPIEAQSDSNIVWSESPAPCSNQSSCITLKRIDGASNLYVFDDSTYMLSIYAPDGSVGVQYDLSSFASVIGVSVDFVPVDTGKVVFEGLVASSGGFSLSAFDVQSEQVVRLNFPLPNRLKSCDSTITGLQRELHYLSPNKILICSLLKGDYSFHIFNLSTQSIERTPLTRSGKAAEGIRPPWYHLATGKDGSIYLQFSNPPMSSPPSSFFYKFVPGTYSISSTSTPIVKYDPNQQTWSLIQVANDSLPIEPGDFGPFAEIVGGDEHENIFFQVITFRNNTTNADYVKLNPNGDKVWRLSDEGLGNSNLFIGIIDSNHIATTSETRAGVLTVHELTSSLPKLVSGDLFSVTPIDTLFPAIHTRQISMLRVSETNVLYTITNTDEGLLAFQPGVSDPTIYPIPPDSFLYGGSFDFEPFGDDFILFFALNRTGNYGFYRFDLETKQVTPLNLKNDFIGCDSNIIGPLERSFQRFGTSQNIIACSRDSFYVIDLSTQTIVDHVTFPTDLNQHPLFRPWGEIVAGADGMVYLKTSNFPNNKLMSQIFPTLDLSNYAEDTTFVLRHAVSSSTWSIIAIPSEQITRAQPDILDISSNRLVKVDERGNLYFYRRWYGTDNVNHVDITKLNSRGERVWRLTEINFGTVPVLMSLLPDNDLLLLDMFENGKLKLLHVKE